MPVNEAFVYPNLPPWFTGRRSICGERICYEIECYDSFTHEYFVEREIIVDVIYSRELEINICRDLQRQAINTTTLNCDSRALFNTGATNWSETICSSDTIPPNRKNKNTCICCGTQIVKIGKTHTSSVMICSACKRTRTTCSNCGAPINGDIGCINCSDQVSILPYYTKPNLYYHAPINKLLLGFEHELELISPSFSRERSRRNIARKMWIHNQIAGYVKQDGSLRYGLEYVSYPFTLEQFEDIFGSGTYLFPPNFRYSRRAGFHVHMNRKVCSPLHIYKMGYLLYNNRSYTRKIAERAENRYCHLISTTNFKKEVLNKREVYHNRYYRLNLTNDNTVEIRMFRGARSVDDIKKNLQFCHALYNFTLDASLSYLHNSTQRKLSRHFNDFVCDNSKLYRQLATFVRGERN